MNHSRRRILQLAAGIALVPIVSRVAAAQPYPSRPVRILVGAAPGGAFDILARLIGQSLLERLGQPFIIENKPGAGSSIAAEAAANAPSDGYTLLLVSSANAVNATLYEQPSFKFPRDIAPVAGIVRQPQIMLVNPAFPAKTVPEFIVYATANPGKINMASTGVGTSVHLAGELFKVMTGINMVHVPYRGGAPALTDMISGQVQVMFADLPSSLAHIQSGALRALAVTTATRSGSLPHVPTVGETLAGYEASSWYGIGAPMGTPPETIELLNREINAGLANPGIKVKLAEAGTTPMPFTPAEFGAHVAAETEKWAKVVKFAGAKPD